VVRSWHIGSILARLLLRRLSGFEQLMAAPSKGRFFDQRIREKFKTLKAS
jgi:hypothetical protein